jgi:hypothetical protein
MIFSALILYMIYRTNGTTMNVTLSPLKDVISPKVLVRQENGLLLENSYKLIF